MKFDGINFRIAKNIINLPVKNEVGELMPYVKEGKEFYVCFGRVVKQGEKKDEAIKTYYKWQDTGEPVYAVPVEIKGHSLTNMAYGTDGRAYLMYDGKCFTAVLKKKKSV